MRVNKIPFSLFIVLGICAAFLQLVFPLTSFKFLLMPLAITAVLYQLKQKHFFISILIVGLALFTRTFSHISFRCFGNNVFITEAVIIATIATLSARLLIYGKFKLLNYPLKTEFILFYTVFIISLITGLVLYEDKLFVLRHSAIFYYSAFFFLTPLVFDNLEKIETLLKVLFIAMLIWPALFLFNILSSELTYFSYFYYFIAILFELFCIVLSPKSKFKNVAVVAIILQLMVFLICEARAAWVGALISILFIYFLSGSGFIHPSSFNKIFGYAIKLSMVFFIIILLIRPSLYLRVSNEILSIFFISFAGDKDTTSSVNNSKWRLFVWSDILAETMKEPLLGMGFGKKFIPKTIKSMGWGIGDTGFVDPHNSFLSVLYRTGFVGLSVFLLLLTNFFLRYIRLLKHMTEGNLKMLMVASLTSMIFILATSCFMVVLEGPYFAVPFWVLMGLVVSLENIYKTQPKCILP